MKACTHRSGASLGCAECVRDVRAHLPEFPLQVTRDQRTKPGPTRIPWPVAEKAWNAYHQRYRNDQSVERLAERGGFDWAEMDMFHPGWREEVDPVRTLAAENARLKEQLAVADEVRKAIEPYRKPLGEQDAETIDAEGWALVVACVEYDKTRGTP